LYYTASISPQLAENLWGRMAHGDRFRSLRHAALWGHLSYSSQVFFIASV